MLVVQPDGGRSWVLRYQLHDRRRDMGLGPYPEISLARARDVKAVDTQGVLDVLRPIWTDKPETASRVRQRIEAVLDYATATGRALGRQSGPLEGPSRPSAAEAEQGAGRSSTMPRWTGARRPRSWPSWRSARACAAKALAFAILTAARSGEVRGMTWAEIDDADGGLDRAGRPHEGRQGASGAADASGAALLGERGVPDCAGVPGARAIRPSRCRT